MVSTIIMCMARAKSNYVIEVPPALYSLDDLEL